jgi:hypothetical protein
MHARTAKHTLWSLTCACACDVRALSALCPRARVQEQAQLTVFTLRGAAQGGLQKVKSAHAAAAAAQHSRECVSANVGAARLHGKGVGSAGSQGPAHTVTQEPMARANIP